MLENHSKIGFHRKWEQPKLKGKPKHTLKVHVWVGISKRGPTRLITLERVMDAEFYVSEILSNRLLPFICKTFPDSHHLQQDNNLKHTSCQASTVMEEKHINCWKTPPQYLDLNPIELLWHELKLFLQTIVKPKTKEELIDEISRFWNEGVDAVKCCKYI